MIKEFKTKVNKNVQPSNKLDIDIIKNIHEEAAHIKVSKSFYNA